jgi:hypothetical protein
MPDPNDDEDAKAEAMLAEVLASMRRFAQQYGVEQVRAAFAQSMEMLTIGGASSERNAELRHLFGEKAEEVDAYVHALAVGEVPLTAPSKPPTPRGEDEEP